MKRLILTTGTMLLGLFFASSSFAQTNTCQPIYGGGQTCVQSGNLLVDKKIKHPTQPGQFVDHLVGDNPRFGPDQEVVFTIDVKNTSNKTINGITVQDVFPPALNFTDRIGEFDLKSKIFTYTIDKLNAGETKRITIKARTVKANAFPNTDEIACLVNQVQVFTSKTKNNPSQDNSRFCIQRPGVQRQQTTPTAVPTVPSTTKGGLLVAPQPTQTKSPKTGPEALALIALIPSGIAGLFLRKKTSIK